MSKLLAVPAIHHCRRQGLAQHQLQLVDTAASKQRAYLLLVSQMHPAEGKVGALCPGREALTIMSAVQCCLGKIPALTLWYTQIACGGGFVHIQGGSHRRWLPDCSAMLYTCPRNAEA
jgi:hypothetical protein